VNEDVPFTPSIWEGSAIGTFLIWSSFTSRPDNDWGRGGGGKQFHLQLIFAMVVVLCAIRWVLGLLI
jgi:hypothetical protein